VTPEFFNQIGPLALKGLVGLALTGLLGVFMWPFRRARKEWNTLREEQRKIHEELVLQRTNCLATLQTQGATQIELLGKSVEALGGVRLELADQTGYLRAITAQPQRRRRIATKK